MRKTLTPEIITELEALLAGLNQDELDVLAVIAHDASDVRRNPTGPSVSPGDLLGRILRLGDRDRVDLIVSARRLTMGRTNYGPLSIEHDPRNWEQEAHEEFIDGAIYLACETIRRERKRA